MSNLRRSLESGAVKSDCAAGPISPNCLYSLTPCLSYFRTVSHLQNAGNSLMFPPGLFGSARKPVLDLPDMAMGDKRWVASVAGGPDRDSHLKAPLILSIILFLAWHTENKITTTRLPLTRKSHRAKSTQRCPAKGKKKKKILSTHTSKMFSPNEL